MNLGVCRAPLLTSQACAWLTVAGRHTQGWYLPCGSARSEPMMEPRRLPAEREAGGWRPGVVHAGTPIGAWPGDRPALQSRR